MSIQQVQKSYEELRVQQPYNIKNYAEALKKYLPKGPLWNIDLPDEKQLSPKGIPSEEAMGDHTVGEQVNRYLYFGGQWGWEYSTATKHYYRSTPEEYIEPETQIVKISNEANFDVPVFLIRAWEWGLDPDVQGGAPYTPWFQPAVHWNMEFFNNDPAPLVVPANGELDLVCAYYILQTPKSKYFRGYLEIREQSPTGPIVWCKTNTGGIINRPWLIEANRDPYDSGDWVDDMSRPGGWDWSVTP